MYEMRPNMAHRPLNTDYVVGDFGPTWHNIAPADAKQHQYNNQVPVHSVAGPLILI